MSAPVVQAAGHLPAQAVNGGARPTLALRVQPIPFTVAKLLIVRHHYLHSLPGGTQLAFGVYLGQRLLGAMAFGVGPFHAHRLLEGANPDDCLTLTRFWLSDELPRNGESKVLGIVLKALKRHSVIKFLITYADPAQGHVGTIYQATGWLYTGFSEATPKYDVGDGQVHHSRSLSHSYGTHSVRHFAAHDVPVRLVAQVAKHRYLYILDPSWRPRLRVPPLPYPK